MVRGQRNQKMSMTLSVSIRWRRCHSSRGNNERVIFSRIWIVDLVNPFYPLKPVRNSCRNWKSNYFVNALDDIKGKDGPNQIPWWNASRKSDRHEHDTINSFSDRSTCYKANPLARADRTSGRVFHSG